MECACRDPASNTYYIMPTGEQWLVYYYRYEPYVGSVYMLSMYGWSQSKINKSM